MGISFEESEMLIKVTILDEDETMNIFFQPFSNRWIGLMIIWTNNEVLSKEEEENVSFAS